MLQAHLVAVGARLALVGDATRCGHRRSLVSRRGGPDGSRSGGRDAALVVAVAAWRRRRRTPGTPTRSPRTSSACGRRSPPCAPRRRARSGTSGIVRYDAFETPAAGCPGRWRCWTTRADGVVMTAIHGRSEARSYAKSISGWNSEQPLSPEESRPWGRRGHGLTGRVERARRPARDAASRTATRPVVRRAVVGRRTGEVAMPWDRTSRTGSPVAGDTDGERPRAVLVGCGSAPKPSTGRAGWATMPSNLPRCRRGAREPTDCPVDYRAGNLLDPSPDLVGAFDLVAEIYTVQALHPSVRRRGRRSAPAPRTRRPGARGPGGPPRQRIDTPNALDAEPSE